jgi:hypothetical protein
MKKIKLFEDTGDEFMKSKKHLLRLKIESYMSKVKEDQKDEYKALVAQNQHASKKYAVFSSLS